MTTTPEKPLTAIPTVYRGIQLKSRMEAQCAVLFDKLGWEWEYEPFSLMLPSGLTYIPDFYVNSPIDGIIECRGYESERGIRQIDEFVALTENTQPPHFILPNGENLHDFLVIGPQIAAHYKTARPWRLPPPNAKASEREDYQLHSIILHRCKCGWQVYTHSWCPNCEKFASAALAVTVANGRVFANGVAVEDVVL